jgi:hypothetical protein
MTKRTWLSVAPVGARLIAPILLTIVSLTVSQSPSLAVTPSVERKSSSPPNVTEKQWLAIVRILKGKNTEAIVKLVSPRTGIQMVGRPSFVSSELSIRKLSRATFRSNLHGRRRAYGYYVFEMFLYQLTREDRSAERHYLHPKRHIWEVALGNQQNPVIKARVTFGMEKKKLIIRRMDVSMPGE